MISSSAKFTICSYPYNYLIIEDCFETNAAYGLSPVFNDLTRSGRSVGKVGEVGDLVYDAINFTPTTDHVRNTPIANIASGELKALIADVFRIQLDDNVMIGMHRHNPPSKPGWTHTDFAVVSFPNVPPTHNGLQQSWISRVATISRFETSFRTAQWTTTHTSPRPQSIFLGPAIRYSRWRKTNFGASTW